MVFDNRSDKFLKSESLNGKEKRKEKERKGEKEESISSI